MKLQDQVCSLEMAKRLMELGVRQESWLWWIQEPTHERKWILKSDAEVAFFVGKENALSAFTVAELGEMLPAFYSLYRYTPPCGWEVVYADAEAHKERAKTEADARAKVLIHLIERGIVRP